MTPQTPCERRTRCTVTNGCKAWRALYLSRQDKINGYARAITPKPVPDGELLALRRDAPGAYLAWLRSGVCGGCVLSESCDTPCPAYLQWWDARMEHFRRRLSV